MTTSGPYVIRCTRPADYDAIRFFRPAREHDRHLVKWKFPAAAHRYRR